MNDDTLIEDIHKLWLQSEPSPWEILDPPHKGAVAVYAPDALLGQISHWKTAEFICLVGNKWHRVYNEVVRLRAEVERLTKLQSEVAP